MTATIGLLRLNWELVMKDEGMNQTGNDNQQLNSKYTMQEVDNLARELCTEFNNYPYFRWYCKAIWKLGIPRIQELRGRVQGAKLAGRLFTQYVKEDLKRLEAEEKLRGLHAKKNDQPSS